MTEADLAKWKHLITRTPKESHKNPHSPKISGPAQHRAVLTRDKEERAKVCLKTDHDATLSCLFSFSDRKDFNVWCFWVWVRSNSCAKVTILLNLNKTNNQ